ncbi:TetR/AcrR family transcriptional regulator [Lysobacter niabensis]|uniref:TetR/AcrR family transcriptional regulator n=1 Tax=Agrilutibacter niabensis TaxID=380628 RepID=UPI00361A2424
MGGTKGAYHHGDLRRELVATATDILRREGGDELTLRAVARAAGVSQTAPYRHFPDKSSLLAAVAETGFSKLDARCEDALAATAGARNRLHQLGKAYVQFALDEPALFRLMFSAELGKFKDEYPELVAKGKRVHDLMRATVEEILSEADAAKAELETSCAAAWSLVHGLAFLLIDRGIRASPHETDALVDGVTRLFARGLP